jgi:hypothetical protein
VADRHRNQPGRIKRRAAAHLGCIFYQLLLHVVVRRRRLEPYEQNMHGRKLKQINSL